MFDNDPDFDPIPLFFPYANGRVIAAKSRNTRLVHYTSSEVAVSIFTSKTVWMRNALIMNDWQEINHGLTCFSHLRESLIWDSFSETLNSIFPNIMGEFFLFIDTRLGSLKYETYITSLSEHLDEEDDLGRLSMWRAYGGNNGVALVVNQDPFMYVSHVSEARSCPVLYANPETFVANFEQVSQNARKYAGILSKIGRARMFDILTTMYLYFVLGTKHPGFHEEREWRVLYMPWLNRTEALRSSRRFVQGMYQTVYEIPLVDDSNVGLHKADTMNLLNRLIIGPTQNPTVPFQAFTSLLIEQGITDAQQKVVVSNIPLRR